MLDYLVPGETRRRLLVALWRRGERGSASDLSRLTGVSFAGAYEELKAMEKAGLAVSHRAGQARVYEKNLSHPASRVVQELLDERHEGEAREERWKMTRGRLVALGAPLSGAAVPAPSVEKAIVAGIHLAHADASVARALPICIWRCRHRLDPEILLVEARRQDEKLATGFFLDLTAELSGDGALKLLARGFRDRRVRRTRDFFPASARGYARRLAEANTPRAASRWHWRMNVGMDSFEILFEKHTREP